MTTTNPVGTPSPSAATPATNAQKQLSSNFDTFLQLLTTQLKNQDPTAPMDSTQFTQQLVMFSQVEQQINTNTNLQTLIGSMQGQANNLALSYLGHKVVLTNGAAALTGGSASWTYGLPNDAKTTSLTVTDAAGKTVYSKAGETAAGAHTFNWDGKDYQGNQLADGIYQLTVSSSASDGTVIKPSVASTGTVSGIDMAGSTPQLVIGTTEVPLSSATLVTN
jgi:flagellar basal-body rod modification protein FlgD